MDQDLAFAILKSGQNAFLTGSAGTGKSYVTSKYITYLKERKVRVAITASTGIAATHVQGQTIHSWSGLGLRDEMSQRQIQNLKKKKYLLKNLTEAKVLIVDEISMLHRRQFETLDKILKVVREDTRPFGGIQLIVSGDFLQLPPIGRPGEKSKDKFVFMSPSWVEADLKICYLTKQYRQSDNQLLELLNEIRSGVVSDASKQALHSKISEWTEKQSGTYPHLYTHNVDVDRINRSALEKLASATESFHATIEGNEKMGEMLKRSVLAPDPLVLKEGAEVMFVKNNFDRGYSNGSLGRVISFNEEGYPMIQLRNGKKIDATPEDWTITDDGGKRLVSYRQVPLRLAWAITVHKSQGMTLDSASMDLSKAFEAGQGFVALSRLRDWHSLTLMGINDKALELDALARAADRRLRQLSDDLSAQVSEKDLEKYYDDFILRSGGTIDAKEVKRNKEKINNVKKTPTHILTKELVDRGYDLGETAKARGLTESTIANHLVKVKNEFPDFDLTPFLPDQDYVRRISDILEEDGDDGVSRKEIFSKLGGEVSYPMISLALAAINEV